MSGSDALSQNEIDNLLNSLTANLDETQEEQPLSVSLIDTFDEERKGYKLYNFRRPDKFSKDHLKAIYDIHKAFSRHLELILASYLRLGVEIDVVSVDQLTFDEFARSLPNPLAIGILELNPLPGQIFLGMSHEIISCMVDRMLGGTGSGEIQTRELTDIEESLAAKIFDKSLEALEESWKSIFPVRGSVIGVDSNNILNQLVNPSEVVVLITLEIQIAEIHSGLLSFCLPFPVLETVLGKLSHQKLFKSKGKIVSPEDKQRILNKLHNSSMKLNVLLGTTDITIADLLDLKVGDVIKLDNSIEDNLLIKVNEKPKFLGRPGTMKNKVAINIVTDIKEPDDEL